MESLVTPASAPSPELLAAGLSRIGVATRGRGCAYRELFLTGRNLGSLDFLRNYASLEFVDLPGNRIHDASGIAEWLPSLYSLFLDRNEITAFDPKCASECLRHLDLSCNKLRSMCGLTERMPYLCHLCADSNEIESLQGLSTCRNLVHLSVAGNQLTTLAGLGALPLRYLNVRNNRLTGLEQSIALPVLEHLDVGDNLLSSLLTLATTCACLSTLETDGNLLGDLQSTVEHLESFPALRELRLDRNTHPPDRSYVLYRLPALCVLDGHVADASERADAAIKHAPTPPVVAATQRALATAARLRLYATALAADNVLPGLATSTQKPSRAAAIVLCGPRGVGKRTMLRRLVRELPHIFASCVSHTTREPRPGERAGVDYHFVAHAELERMIAAGAVACVIRAWGSWYATSIEAWQRVRESGRIAVFHMELAGAIAFHRTSLVPARYIFLIPPSMKSLMDRRTESGRPALSNECAAALGDGAQASRKELASMMEFWLREARDQSELNSKDISSNETTKSATLINDDGSGAELTLFEQVVVNENLEDCYCRVRTLCMREIDERYEEELQAEREQLDGVGVLSTI